MQELRRLILALQERLLRAENAQKADTRVNEKPNEDSKQDKAAE